MAPLILKLPPELLLNIAAYVGEEEPNEYYHLRKESKYMSPTPILNFSMTCRHLRALSAELLVPGVTVDFRHSSLDRLEEIAHHKGICKGVRTVKVCLRFFSRDLCDNFKKFVEFYVEELEIQIKSEAGSRSKVTAIHKGKGSTESVRVLESWKRVVKQLSESSYKSFHQTEDSINHDLLKRAHKQHKRLYDDQQSLSRAANSFAALQLLCPKCRMSRAWRSRIHPPFMKLPSTGTFLCARG